MPARRISSTTALIDKLDEMRSAMASIVNLYEELKEMLDAAYPDIQRIDEIWRSVSDENGNLAPPRKKP